MRTQRAVYHPSTGKILVWKDELLTIASLEDLEDAGVEQVDCVSSAGRPFTLELANRRAEG